jgi:hypothetical protein
MFCRLLFNRVSILPVSGGKRVIWRNVSIFTDASPVRCHLNLHASKNMPLEPKTLYTQKRPWVTSKGNDLNFCCLESKVVINKNLRYGKGLGSQARYARYAVQRFMLGNLKKKINKAMYWSLTGRFSPLKEMKGLKQSNDK